MNTLLDIVIWGIDQTKADKISAAIIKRTMELELILGRYDKNTETYRLNQTACTNETVISPYMSKIIKRSIDDLRLTFGYFNVFSGNAYSEFKTKKPINPGADNLFPDNPVQIHEDKQTIKFLNKNISLDFGGIGKGIALDEAGRILDSFEAPHAFISFGGSSVLTRGHHPHGGFWPFSFRNQGIEQIWHLNNDAISVSSAVGGGKDPQHIFNPVNAMPVSLKNTAYVQSNSATDAEVLSTALIAAPQELHTKIAGNYNVKNWSLFNI